jgi:hypothetical protein
MSTSAKSYLVDIIDSALPEEDLSFGDSGPPVRVAILFMLQSGGILFAAMVLGRLPAGWTPVSGYFLKDLR